MSRFQMREWTILLAAVILVATGNIAAVVAQDGKDPFGAGKPAPASAADDAAAEAAIRKALHTPTNMEFIETPLQEAVDFLKDLHGIEIQLDSKALEDEGFGSDTPVTRTLKHISLDSALRLLLSNLELTFVVDHGVLLITTPQVVTNMIEIRVYDVHDLLAQGEAADLSEILRLALNPPARMGGIAGSLIPAAAKTQLVQQHATEQGGGFPAEALAPAPQVPAVTGFPRGSVILSYGNLIVVRASIVEHEAIAELLANMRSAMRQAPK